MERASQDQNFRVITEPINRKPEVVPVPLYAINIEALDPKSPNTPKHLYASRSR